MAGKVFKTAFEIGAKFTGQQGFGKVFNQLDKVGRKAKQATASFGKMFGAVVAGINSSVLAWKAFDAVVDIGQASYAAAKDVKKAYDVVRQANALLISERRMSAKDLESRTQKTVKFAETLSKSGLDAETLAVGLAGLSRSFDSKTIEKMGKGWMDWMVKIHKGAPTMEQAQEDAKKLENFILKGNARSLEGMGITKERTAAIAKATKGMSEQHAMEYRSAELAKLLGTETGALVEWLKTDEGVAYSAAQAQESLLEKMGGPMVEATRKLNEAMTELYKALEPVADLIAGYLKQGLDDFAKWIITNKAEIIAFTKMAVTFLKNRLDELIISFQDCYRQGKWLWDHLIISFDDTKAQWNAIVDWLDKYVIKPIYNLFLWLYEKISWIWEQILPKIEAAIPAVSAVGMGGVWQHRIPQASDFRGGAGGGEGGEGYTGEPGEGANIGGDPSNAAVAEARAKLIDEVNKDPVTRARLYARVKGEVGYQGPDAIQKQMENMFNRAWLRGQTMAETVSQGGKAGNYWGGKMKPTSAQEAKLYDTLLAGVKAGSTKAGSATGNESANVRNGRVVATARGGERFVEEPADARKIQKLRDIVDQKIPKIKSGPTSNISTPGPQGDRQTGGTGERTQQGIPDSAYMNDPRRQGINRMIRNIDAKQRTSGDVGGQNIAMSPTINVNGVAAGSEELVAQKVGRVLRNNSKENLAQLRRDRNFQLRTGYV